MLAMYLSVLETQEEKDKFEELYTRYRHIMFKAAFSILNSNEDAEDAVQDALFRIANNFDKISGLNSDELYSNCIITVRSTALGIYRSNKKNADVTELTDDTVSVETAQFDNYAFDELKSKIRELPPIYKDILYLYYIQEYTTKEICRLLNITSGNAWKRVERAKKMLKQKLLAKKE